ncbi:hypothetical protein EYY32_13915 [Escherichia coli]|nr:hypothetical protein [Escherichia coli]TII47496.1 hypothetical protein EYY32_13915 [Escherichia coli]
MYWIINDNIEFWPEHRKLISVHNADLNVVLTTPASRCLSLLLEAFPDVVAQQDFFTRVWEEEGMWICPYISRHLLSLNPLQARCRRYSRGER